MGLSRESLSDKGPLVPRPAPQDHQCGAGERANSLAVIAAFRLAKKRNRFDVAKNAGATIEIPLHAPELHDVSHAASNNVIPNVALAKSV